MKIIHELTLDVSRQGVQASVPITQHDTGTHVLLMHLRNGSKEIKLNSSLTATLYLSNDSYEIVTVYTENGAHPNTLECNVTPYMSSKVGEITAQLQIFEGADRVFSAPEFMLVVKEDKSSGSTVAGSTPFAAVVAAQQAAETSASRAERAESEAVAAEGNAVLSAQAAENAATYLKGEGNTVGLKGFYWYGIAYAGSSSVQIHLTPNRDRTRDYNLDVSKYWAIGDVISIHSEQKWTNCAQIVLIQGETIYVNSLPFSTPTKENEHITDQAVYVLAKPDKGLVEFGQYAVAFGESNKATNYCTFVAGRNNTAMDQYAAVFGRNNKGDYACFIGGRNNIVSQEFGFTAGSNNYIDAKQSGAFGKANFIINNAYRAVAFGAYNSIGGDTTAIRQNTSIVPQNVLSDSEYNKYYSGQYGVALGYGNNIIGFCGVGIGDDNTVRGRRAVSIGYNQQANAESCTAIGHGSIIAEGSTYSVSINGTLANKINYGLGQMIFGSGNTIDTRAKDTTDRHGGSGQYNYIIGGDACTISGNAHQCVVGGKANTATGYRSTVFGDSNNDGGYSHTTVLGRANAATGNYQTVVGTFANPSANARFTVGNGTSTSNRANVFEVYDDCSIRIGNTRVTEDQLKKLLALLN